MRTEKSMAELIEDIKKLFNEMSELITAQTFMKYFIGTQKRALITVIISTVILLIILTLGLFGIGVVK